MVLIRLLPEGSALTKGPPWVHGCRLMGPGLDLGPASSQVEKTMSESESEKPAPGKKKAKASKAKKTKTTKSKTQKSSRKKSLVIVESPAKARTINKYLGSSFVVKASMGHIRDLPKGKFGIDIDNGFTPEYTTIRGKGKVISELKKLAKNAEAVYLAPDMDREGEAIAWHLRETIGGDESRYRRVVFNEITKNAIHEAFEDPGQLNMPRVEAQQARRFLDRVVGFMLSPLLVLSPTFIARESMPGWMSSVATVNPMTYAIEPIRAAFLEPGGGEMSLYLTAAAVLFVFDVVCIALAVRVIKRRLA